jgi:predicted type IV restriction endonuclease
MPSTSLPAGAWRFVRSSWTRVTGRADYLLHVDQKAVGVIEAKP